MLVVPLQRTMGKFRGVPAPGFITLMDSVAMLQRKPVQSKVCTAATSCVMQHTDSHISRFICLTCSFDISDQYGGKMTGTLSVQQAIKGSAYCRLTLTRVDVAVGVDSALLAIAQLLRARGQGAARGGRAHPAQGRARAAQPAAAAGGPPGLACLPRHTPPGLQGASPAHCCASLQLSADLPQISALQPRRDCARVACAAHHTMTFTAPRAFY